MDNKAKVKQQFGRSAADYGTSHVHTSGYSLQRLVDVVEPQSNWDMLDIATGGGHTAHIFAPLINSVVATDITQEMLDVAAGIAADKQLQNIKFQPADAEQLPFDDASFDLVTCRIAAHHFTDIPAFLNEVARVLKPGGTFGLVDNSVPDDDEGADYINAYEVFRDPSHVKCLSAESWEQECFASGLVVSHREVGLMPLEFAPWAARMHVSEDDQLRLKAMLKQAPPTAAAILTPHFETARITFHLQRVIIVAQKRAA